MSFTHSLYKILLGDVASREVPDPIDRHDPDVLDGAQQVLEGDKVAPHPRLVGGLDLVVEVVEDDVVDVLVPAQDLGDLPKPPLSHFHPEEDRIGHIKGHINDRIQGRQYEREETQPKDFVLDLELEF